jgi:hypothetical protein
VLDSSALNTNGFLPNDKCISSTELNMSIWNKESLSPLSKSYIARSIPSKILLNFHRKTMCEMVWLLRQMVFFFLIDTCVSSTQLNKPIWNKESLCPP